MLPGTPEKLQVLRSDSLDRLDSLGPAIVRVLALICQQNRLSVMPGTRIFASNTACRCGYYCEQLVHPDICAVTRNTL